MDHCQRLEPVEVMMSWMTSAYRRFKDETGKTHFVWRTYIMYTKEEAIKEGISFVHWRQGRKGGEWVCTDDDLVMQLVKDSRLFDGKGKERMWGKQYGPLYSCTLPKVPYLSGQKDLFYRERLNRVRLKKVRQVRTRIAVYTYAQMLFKGRIQWDQIGQIICPNSRNRYQYARFLFRKPEVLTMVKQEVANAMLKTNFTIERVMEEYNHLIDMCKEKKDREQLRETLEFLAGLFDMLPEQKQLNMNMNMTVQPQMEASEETKQLMDETEMEMMKALEVKNAHIEVIRE